MTLSRRCASIALLLFTGITMTAFAAPVAGSKSAMVGPLRVSGREYRAQSRDIASWLAQPGNKHVRIVHAGASKLARVGEHKLWRAYGATATVLLGGLATLVPNPLTIGSIGIAGFLTQKAAKDIRSATKSANTYTVVHSLSVAGEPPNRDRLKAWIAAGQVDGNSPLLAKYLGDKNK